MKITRQFGLLDVGGELAQRLAHQARLQTDVRIAHLALDLGLGRERRHRVDHDHVHGTGTHQHVGDLQRLLAGVRLATQQVVHVHAQLFRVARVQRVLGIDEGRGAALALAFGDHLQGQRGLARGFRTVDLDHAAARQTAHAQRDVQAQRAGGNGVDGDLGMVAHAHHGALAELLLDLAERGSERAALVVIHRGFLGSGCCHGQHAARASHALRPSLFHRPGHRPIGAARLRP